VSVPTSEIAAMPVDPDLVAGEVVGEYRVDGKLGQGAFGTVFKAVHPLIGKVVAIKVLARKYSVDPEMVSRFIAEARAVNQIRHRNIIDIFSFGQLPDGRHYYVMEYLDGAPLDARLERAGRLTLGEALPILRGVARALDAAHAKSIAHRDLKAENVFLATDPDGGVWPKLLDFGIAKLLADEPDGAARVSHKTRTGYSVGTPYYMSPEQARGRDVDHRTDHYAFGVLAYVMLVGAYPFDGDDYVDILMKQLQEAPPRASARVPELPAAVDDVIAQLMAKDPADRPRSLRDAVLALEEAAAAAGLEVGAWHSSSGPVGQLRTEPPRAAPQRAITVDLVRRSRAPRVVASTLAAIAAGIAAFYLAQRGGEREPAPATGQPTLVPVAVDAGAAPAPGAAFVAAPAAPTTATIAITGTPEGTEVVVAGDVIGVAPGPVQLPRGDAPLVLTFRADGHVPASRTVTPDRDQALAVPLKPKPARARARAGSTRDEIIDVFDRRP